MHRVCVFAASREGTGAARDLFAAAARATGEGLARRGWGMVYGGARVGLMGAAADAALAAGGEVQGVIPSSMVTRELAHGGLTQLHVVDSMHARKARMHELSSAFLAIPGGFGTLDELFETLTWSQLGFHGKPVGLLDVDGFWQPLVRWIERAVGDGLVAPEHAAAVLVRSDVEAILDLLGPR